MGALLQSLIRAETEKNFAVFQQGPISNLGLSTFLTLVYFSAFA